MSEDARVALVLAGLVGLVAQARERGGFRPTLPMGRGGSGMQWAATPMPAQLRRFVAGRPVRYQDSGDHE